MRQTRASSTAANETDLIDCPYLSKNNVWLTVLLYVSTPICLTGFALNAISFVILRKHNSRSNSFHLLQILAVVDNCFLLVSVSLVNARRFFAYLTYGWQFFYLSDAFIGPRFLVYLAPPHLTMRMIRNWLIVLMSLDRAIHIVFPLKSIVLCTKFKLNLSFAFIVACSVGLHGFKFCCLTLAEQIPKCPAIDIPLLRFHNEIPAVFGELSLVALIIILPFVILCVTNTILSVHLYQARTNRQMLTSGGPQGKDQELQATLLALGIVVTFLVCESPNSVERIVEIAFYDGKRLRTHPMMQVSIQIDSCVNFLVYCLSSKKFRTLTAQMLTMRKE
ncbi:FMRFamide receptor-like [Tubulanus polymorphus]|uniref:FMRFamide receptor-like n=1 Tax=Tubulanus polymorphus TaxID=672921 RepID=UPI003DA34D97